MEGFGSTCQKAITIIGVVVAMVAGVIALDDRYVSSKDLAQLEQKTVKTLDEFRRSQKFEYLIQRYETLNDSWIRTRMLLKAHPDDRELQEDISRISQERDDVKRQLDVLKSN